MKCPPCHLLIPHQENNHLTWRCQGNRVLPRYSSWSKSTVGQLGRPLRWRVGMRSSLCLLRECLGVTYVAEATLGEGHSDVQSEFVRFPIRGDVGTSGRKTSASPARTTGSPVSYWNSSQVQRIYIAHLLTGERAFSLRESLSNIDRDRDRDPVLRGKTCNTR